MKRQGIRFFQHVMKPIHRYAALLAVALTLSGTAAFADQVSFDGYTFNYNPLQIGRSRNNGKGLRGSKASISQPLRP